jgi:hypothetical protein
MEVGFAGGGSLLDFASNLTATSLLGLSPQQTYQEILDLQASRIPFDVVTGKRLYSNMLIRALEVTTDKTTENVLSAVLTLREVLIRRRSGSPSRINQHEGRGQHVGGTEYGTKTTAAKHLAAEKHHG